MTNGLYHPESLEIQGKLVSPVATCGVLGSWRKASGTPRCK